MIRAARPLWLIAPTRFAGLRRDQARVVLAMVAALMFTVMTALVAPVGLPVRAAVDAATPMTDDNIVERVRHGEAYYPVAADELRHADQPMRPFTAVHLPTLTVLLATLPARWRVAPLALLALAVLIAWARRLKDAFSRRPPLIVPMLLLAAGTLASVDAGMETLPELWAGLFVALSLGVRWRGRWVEAAAFGLCAMLVWEGAALYAVLMAAAAWGEGERREAGGWLACLALFAAVLATHAHAVAGVVRLSDPASPGWLAIRGVGFFARAVIAGTGLRLVPLVLAAPLLGLSFAGWAAWRDPLAVRAGATVWAFALLIASVAPSSAAAWALVIAPVSLVGLAFVPDAARDLARAAFDRRRITVTRLAR